MTTSTKTGGSVDYYTCSVPAERTIDGRPGYDAQCLEIIETLGMSFAEGEAFKAIWRSCAARTLGKVKADCDALYNAEKVAFYGQRMVVEARMQAPGEGTFDATCEAGAEKFDQSEWGKSELPKSAIPEGATHHSEAVTGVYFEAFWKEAPNGVECYSLDDRREPRWVFHGMMEIPARAKRIGGSAQRPLAGS